MFTKTSYETLLANEADIDAPNRYNKNVNEAKENFNEHLRDKILSHPIGSRPFWILTKHVKNNFNSYTFLLSQQTKASGSDRIPALLFKKCAPELVAVLSKLSLMVERMPFLVVPQNADIQLWQ